MSGGPPHYGFNSGYNPNQYPGAPPTHFPSAPFPNHPGGIPTHFPPPGQATTNFYPTLPTGDTHFTSSFTPQSHTSFTPQSHTSFTPQSHTSFTPQSHTSFPQGNTSFTPAYGPRWVHWSKGQMMPAHAVIGGRDCDGTSIYVGRLHHKHDLIPAKVLPMKHVAYVSYDGKEIPYTSCEILCHERPTWTPSSNGHVPAGAIPVGNTKKGETLYAARFHHNGSLSVGKLHPSHRTCYIPFGGKEVGNPNYEVLTG